MLPEVAILVPTYNRGNLLAENLQYLFRNLKYEGPLRVVVGDDSDNDALAFDARELQGQDFYQRHNPTRGLGANLNWLRGAAGCDYAMQMDDDHRLLKPLDITPHMRRLTSDPSSGWIRLMGVAAHKLTATLDEDYWRVDWNSAELYITSNRPHLKRLKDWAYVYGPYPEGLKLGQTEESYCHRCIDIARERLAGGKPTLDVLVPLNQDDSAWTETGHSWQLEGF